jgi:hypothetical protein
MFSKMGQYINTLRPRRELSEGQGSAVVVVICYDLGGPGLRHRWEREIFSSFMYPSQPWGPPCLRYNGYLGSLWGLKWPKHGVSHHRLSILRVETTVPLVPIVPAVAYCWVTFTRVELCNNTEATQEMSVGGGGV